MTAGTEVSAFGRQQREREIRGEDGNFSQGLKPPVSQGHPSLKLDGCDGAMRTDESLLSPPLCFFTFTPVHKCHDGRDHDYSPTVIL